MKHTMHTPPVSIVIPNWNGKDLMRKNLPSVVAAAKSSEIIVVDDGSSDDSVAFLRKEYPGILVIEKNLHDGFASTVNTGVDHARGEIVVLLNTDTKPEKDFLSPLLRHFTDQSVFAVGCLERSHEGSAVVNRGRGCAGWSHGFFIHEKGDVNATDTAWVSGGSGAFRKKLWQMLGGMDSIYNPFYWEDIDLSYRAMKSGYSIFFEPKSIIDHFHEEGKIRKEFSQHSIRRIAYRNQFIFIWKNLSDVNIWLSHCFYVPIRIVQAFFRGDIPLISGYVLALVKLPTILIRRKRQSRYWKTADSAIAMPPIQSGKAVNSD